MRGRDLPGSPAPGVAQITEWMRHPTRLMDRARRRYGDRFAMRWPGFQSVIMVSHPEDVRAVFLGSPEVYFAGEGNQLLEPILGSASLIVLDVPAHPPARKMLLPPLHGDRMRAYGAFMQDEARRALRAMPVGKTVRMDEITQTITLRVILHCVFGMQTERELGDAHAALAAFADVGNSPMLFLPMLQRDLGAKSPWGRVVRAMDRADGLIRRQIEERRAKATEADDDVLALLLAARDADGRGLSDRQLRDQLATLLVAGHETTSAALCWLAAEVWSRPEVAAALAEEIAAAGGEDASPDTLAELPLLDSIVRETLRLRPVIPVVARVTKQEVRVGDLTVEAGTHVMPSAYLAGRHEANFERPDTFLMDRFLGKKPDPYAWFPFGGGSRRCIGMAFALYELKVVFGTWMATRALGLDAGYRPGWGRRGISLVPSEGTPIVRFASR